MDTLPQVCVRCRKLKMPSLGKFFKSRTKYNHRYFICDACLAKPQVERLGRLQHPPSPLEVECAAELKMCGFKVYQEYALGAFIYDFAVPDLRLLVEVDSPAYHKSLRQLRRDKRKSEFARSEQWKLARVEPPGVGFKATLEVNRRAAELGLEK